MKLYKTENDFVEKMENWNKESIAAIENSGKKINEFLKENFEKLKNIITIPEKNEINDYPTYIRIRDKDKEDKWSELNNIYQTLKLVSVIISWLLQLITYPDVYIQ